MNNPIDPFLHYQPWLVLDGALATELEQRGALLDDPLWSARVLLERPGLIGQVHEAYFRAGADVAITASYQASFEGFARRGLSREQSETLLRLSVRLAVEARDAFWAKAANRAGRLRPLVAASVGPYGAFLADGSEYRGDYGLSRRQLIDWHRPRLAVLADSGADLLACETIPCLREAEALVELLAEFPGTRAWLSFSCCDGEHLCHGEPFREAAALAESCLQVMAVGINCTPPEYVEALLRSAAGHTGKSRLVYPNSGEAWDAQRHCWVSGGRPVDFGALARRWYAAGARLIGGCCRTRPADTEQIRAALLEVSFSRSVH